jgi:hypothetical protein
VEEVFGSPITAGRPLGNPPTMDQAPGNAAHSRA